MKVRPATSDDNAAIERLVAASPLSERKMIDLAAAPRMGTGFIAETDAGDAVGYLHMHPYDDHWSAEMATRDSDAVAVLVAEAANAVMPDAIHVWALDHDHVAALDATGRSPERVLHQMRRPLPPDRRSAMDDSITVATFRPGVDDERWLELNNEVFAGHPENGHWTQADLEDRMRQPWFDPVGFLLAWEFGSLVGSCWTKRHPATDLGEIYVIGVHPGGRGRGLGVDLTLAGLWDLAERQSASTALLYVDAANAGAVGMYEGLGFESVLVNRCYLA